MASTTILRPLFSCILPSLQRWSNRFWFGHTLDTSTNPRPWLPADEQVVISVWNLRCMVSSWEWSEDDGGYLLVRTSNAEALEDEARHAVEAQDGAINISGIYACPSELAAKARFGSEGGQTR